MDGGASNRSAVIQEVFKTMDCKEILEKTTGFAWLKDNKLFAWTNASPEAPEEAPAPSLFQLKNVNNADEILCNIYIPTRSKIQQVLAKSGSDWTKLKPIDRAGLIHKLASEVRQNQAGICQAEVAARGLQSRETKKHLELLTDHLEYYAGFCFKCKDDSPPEGVSVGIFSDQSALFLLGSNLGPALAAGYNVVLLTEPKISYVTSLLLELSRKVGIPEGTIQLIPSTGENLDVFFAHSNVGIVSIFGHHSQQFNFINCFNKLVLNYSTVTGIPMLVFDSADLDSACQSVVNAAWGYQGMLPWNVRNVLVQENILDVFYAKLKHALSSAKVGQGNVQNVDVALPIKDDAVVQLERIVEISKENGIEVFRTDTKNVFPLTILSGKPFTNMVVEKDPIDVPLVVLTAFRSIDEAVNLANNSKQGLAASVWTDSLSLANEVVRKLQVTTVWINSHGKFSADVPVTPYKNSGKGSFGGKAGFYEFYNLPKASSDQVEDQEEHDRNNKIAKMEDAIRDMKKARSSWAKASKLERFKKLEAVITKASKKEHANIWLEALYQYDSKQLDGCSNTPTFNVTVTREPRGIIAVEVEDTEPQTANVIVTALMEGNGIIVLAATVQATDFYSVLAPSGIVKVLPKSLQAAKVAALHKELDVYFGTGRSEPFKMLSYASKFQIVPSNSDEAIHRTTLVKSVWSNVGQSFM